MPYTSCLACDVRFFAARSEEHCPGCGTLVDRSLALCKPLEQPPAEAVGHWEWDIVADIVSWSPTLLLIYGITEPEQKPTSYDAYLEHIHPDDRSRIDRTLRTAFVARSSFAFTHRIVLPDGSERTLRAFGHVVTDEAGRPARMMGTAIDISDAT